MGKKAKSENAQNERQKLQPKRIANYFSLGGYILMALIFLTATVISWNIFDLADTMLTIFPNPRKSILNGLLLTILLLIPSQVFELNEQWRRYSTLKNPSNERQDVVWPIIRSFAQIIFGILAVILFARY